MPNEIYAELVITSASMRPDEITLLVGLEPTESWRTGEIFGAANVRRRKENGWVLASGLDRSKDLSQHLASLMAKIAPRSEQLRNLADCSIEVACVLYAYDYVPAMHFDSAIVSLVAAIGAEIDIDLYNLEGVRDSKDSDPT